MALPPSQTGNTSNIEFFIPVGEVPLACFEAVKCQRGYNELIVYSSVAQNVVRMAYPLDHFGLKIFPSTLKQYFEDKGRYIACFCGLQNIHPPPAARFVTGNHPSVIYAVCHFASSNFNNTNLCGFFLNLSAIYFLGSLTSDFSNLPSPNIANFESFASLAMEQLKNDYQAPSSFVVAPVLVGYGGEFVVLNSGMRQLESLNAYPQDRCSHGHEPFHQQNISELAPLSSALSGIRSHARANAPRDWHIGSTFTRFLGDPD
ncbi:hypothetical protein EV359DRAFT_82240 [Lentinula novae-zelandiae]|nr:hypothetical protein EV359DRAFT_82240 [Lentinula novae-zelandiae]